MHKLFMKEEVHYDHQKEDHGMVSEPVVGSELRQPVTQFRVATDDSLPGTFGFYTEDSDEFEQRKEQLIAEAQQFDHATSSEQMWSELRSNFLWLK